MKNIVIPLGIAVPFSCSDDMKNLQQLSVQKRFPQGEAYDFKLVYTDSSKVVAVLIGPLDKDFSNQQMPYSEFPKEAKVEFYDQARHKNAVQAKYDIIYPSADMVELRDSVVLTACDGRKLNTAQLLRDQREDWIFTDREFTFTDTKKGTATKEIGMGFDKKFPTIKAHETTGILSIEDKDE